VDVCGWEYACVCLCAFVHESFWSCCARGTCLTSIIKQYNVNRICAHACINTYVLSSRTKKSNNGYMYINIHLCIDLHTIRYMCKYICGSHLRTSAFGIKGTDPASA